MGSRNNGVLGRMPPAVAISSARGGNAQASPSETHQATQPMATTQPSSAP